jgi:hypothetical protein
MVQPRCDRKRYRARAVRFPCFSGEFSWGTAELPGDAVAVAESIYRTTTLGRGAAGAGVYGCVRLTGTPCEDAESCSTIWVGRTSGGTSNTSLTLT